MYNKALTTALLYRRKILHPEIRTIQNNKRFKNCHAGKRCFIVGNGPSLKMEDLSLLRDEIVFTVNQAARIPQFKSLKSNYHFCADNIFFRKNGDQPEDPELFNVLFSETDHNSEIEYFFPFQQMGFIHGFHIDDKLNVNYYYPESFYTIYDGFHDSIDFTKPIPVFGTIIHTCICMAVYMGFSEIYLLGCDCTGIVGTIKSILHQNDDQDYAYSISNEEKTRMEKMLERRSYEEFLTNYTNSIIDYRRLCQYCRSRNISLVNCSGETVIKSIPRMRLADVLGGK